MHSYDYSFIQDLEVPANLFRSMYRIQSLDDRLEMMISGNTELFSKLSTIASIESIKGSNAIEGIITTDERVRGIALRKTVPIGHDEMAVAGYRNALDLIHREWKEMDFDNSVMKSLHDTMYSYIGGGGEFKETDNVIADSIDGKTRVRWEPVPASETETHIESMVLAYAKACNDPDIEPIILIPCVILDFLCIHPFSDGNGRMSRLLTDLLMYRHGFTVQKYVSMEAVIDSTKDRYYDALKQSSEGWHENRNDYVPFIRYFIETLNICIKDLDLRRVSSSQRKATKTERIESAVLESLVPISKAEICDMLLDVSPSTVEAVLHRMLSEGRIVKIGTTRSARYRRSE